MSLPNKDGTYSVKLLSEELGATSLVMKGEMSGSSTTMALYTLAL
jgi:hypothetical protein